MGEGPKNGGGSPPPDSAAERELEELQQLAIAQAVTLTATLLKQLFPHLADAKVVEIAQAVTAETPALRDMILPGLADVDPKLPFWGAKIHGGVGTAMLHVPKRLEKDAPFMQAWQYACTLGLLMDPLFRAIVRATGGRYEFFQTAAEPKSAAPERKIIV